MGVFMFWEAGDGYQVWDRLPRGLAKRVLRGGDQAGGGAGDRRGVTPSILGDALVSWWSRTPGQRRCWQLV